ncbi:MAG TPA: PDZ domain-containing protein [Gemmataceae bacterium]|nr:PDZ domain-containing protein [Gemmataceae bacterium]
MTRFLLSLALLLTLGLSPGWSQKPATAQPSPEEKGTFLGILFGPVPDIVYDQVPQLKREHGVVVSHVLPDSPAAKAGLRRNDILLQYDDESVRDCEQVARLVRDDKPERKVRLTYLRGGKEATAEATLVSGPILRIAHKDAGSGSDDQPRGTAKTANPAAVNVAATPLGGNSMKVTIEYYDDRVGRIRTVPCSGTPEEIDTQLAKLPDGVQKLVKVALRRLREPDAKPQNSEPRPER